MSAFVYILESLKDHSYYIGSTLDIEKRLVTHNKGAVKSTKWRRPFVLKYVEKYDNLGKARSRELQIK